jgi:hypothetical protein
VDNNEAYENDDYALAGAEGCGQCGSGHWLTKQQQQQQRGAVCMSRQQQQHETCWTWHT